MSNLTSGDLATPLKIGIPGIACTGHSPAEALRDAARFAWGLGQLGKRTLTAPFTGQGPFASHALEPMLDKLEEEGHIPSKNTFDTVRIVFAGDDRAVQRRVTMQQRDGKWLPQDPRQQVASLPPIIDRHHTSSWVHQVGANSPSTVQESMVSQSLRSLRGANRRQIDVNGPTQQAAAELAADVSKRHPDAVVVIQPPDSKQPGSAGGKSTQVGRIKDAGVWKPRIIAYGTIKEDAEAMARIVAKNRPDAIIVRKWGNASADELAKLRVAEAVDRVLVRRSGSGTKLLEDSAHAPADKAKGPGREAQHIRRGLLSPWESNGSDGSSGSPLALSPVGGIYLRGASEALKALGPLTGLSIDKSTGRLVLLSKERGALVLPPLRLDDVVTVFRLSGQHCQ